MIKFKLNRWEWEKLLRRKELAGGFKLISNTKGEAIVYDKKYNRYLVCCI